MIKIIYDTTQMKHLVKFLIYPKDTHIHALVHARHHMFNTNDS